MNGEPLVTIVVTPRERYAVARRSLETIVANTPEAHRLACVAGGAPDGVQEYLTTACAARGYELILRPQFLPPNVARNLGLERARTKYVAFVENDVVVEPGWLDALIRCAEEEDADVVTPLVLIGEPSARNVHSLGGTLIVENLDGKTTLGERHHCGPICLRTSPRRLTRMAADFSEFHCALVRRSLLEQIGRLDERVLGAAEHIDLALHVRKLGGRAFAEPASVVSYLPTSYTVGDLDTYAPRWSEAWHVDTMNHLASKWNLSPSSPLFHDYFSSFTEIRERCLVRAELRGAPPPALTESLRAAQTIVQLLDQMEALGYRVDALTKVRDAYGVAAELFAGCFRASGRTLLEHGVGTGSILAAFGTNPEVIVAGVLHAAYAHGQFPTGFGDSSGAMRRWLRRRAGERADTLVYEYSRLELENVMSYLPQELDRMPIELANVIIVRIANGIEDRIHGDDRYFDSGVWLEQSNKLIERWMPAFTAVAERLDSGGMAAILRDTVSRAQPDSRVHVLRPARPLNYAIDRGSGAMQPLAGRSMSGPDASEPAAHLDGARCMAINIDAIHPANDGRVSRESGCVRVVADARPWAYSAYADLVDLAGAKGPAIIEIRLHAERGTMGIMVLERGSWDHQVVQEQSTSAAGEPVVVRFEVDAIEEVGRIALRGWPSEDGQTQARVLGASVLMVDGG